MCGIVGVFHYARSEPVPADVLERMRETLHARGPDDAGLWVNEARTVGLAHRRLSIVDLSADGRQPMSNEDGSIWVTFNGEIYNHSGWRSRLERKGHRFRSNSDTEAILHLYEEYGPGCVEHLDGMFAFGLWDEHAQRLLLARDRLGVKPLYYTQQQGMILFASEIKALLAHPLVSRGLDMQAMGLYLTLKAVPAPRTLFQGIQKLEAGTVLTCDTSGNLRQHRYWDPADPSRSWNAACDEDEAVGTIRSLLGQSIAKRQMSDVPIGVFLSGGLDSSAVVALMAPLVSRAINTFSVGIRDLQGYDELDYARQVAERFGTAHREIKIGKEELIAYLPQLVHDQDEPLADPVCVPLYYLSRLARESGVKVVLVGEGSDEQFLGYDSRVNFLKRYRRTWAPLLAMPRGALRGMHATAAAFHRATGLARRPERVLRKAARGEAIFLGSMAFSEEEVDSLLNGTLDDPVARAGQAVADACRPLEQAWPGAEIATRMSYVDLKIRIAELLLMRIDKVTMSVGLEAREPFLDARLVEYTMTLPARLKLKGWEPKHLLKRAMEGFLPENIIRRPKQAFAAPVGAWIRAGLDGYARKVVLESSLRGLHLFRYDAIESLFDDHVAGRADHGVRLWNLMNLSAWYDHWF